MLIGACARNVTGQHNTFRITVFYTANKPPVVFAKGGVVKVGYVDEAESVKFFWQISDGDLRVGGAEGKG